MKCPACGFENTQETRFCGGCAAPLSPTGSPPAVPTRTFQTPLVRELAPGTVFSGRYRVVEEIGRGGMGRVYKAFDLRVKENVALKLIKPEIAADLDALERFGAELRLARKIGHRNVCRMFDLGEAEGAHFITMEFVSGEDLKDMLRMSGSLSPGMILSVGKQVCDGLAEAHALGIVHRDLKPQNIMIDKGGNAKIMDFGIARSLKDKGITGAGVMIGTPEYMSPEQAEAGEVDLRSDLYSLGVILYEMAANRVPFSGETALSVVMKHKLEAPKDPRLLNAAISPELSRLILKCLEKDKTKRFQSAAEVRDELDRIEKGLPTTQKVVPGPRPSTEKTITLKFTTRRALGIGAAALGVLAAVFLGWRLFRAKEGPILATEKPSLAVMYFKNNTGDHAFDIWRSGMAESVITDLAQSKFVNVLTPDVMFGLLRSAGLLEASDYTPEDLKKVASQGRVNHILLGRLSRAGDAFRVEYTLQDMAGGGIVGTGKFDAPGEAGLFAVVDAMTIKVKEDLKIGAADLARDIDRGIGTITSSSPEAYKLYLEGRRLHIGMRYWESIAVMEKAIALDPEFAMAYRSISVTYSNLGYPAQRKKYRELALKYADRLPEAQRYLIEGDYYGDSEDTQLKAVEAYQKLLSLYPESDAGNNNLAIRYDALGRTEQAIEQLESAKRLGDRSTLMYKNLADYYTDLGRYEKALGLIHEAMRDVGDGFLARARLSYLYIEMGKFELAEEELAKAASFAPEHDYIPVIRGHLRFIRDDFEGAIAEHSKTLQSASESQKRNATEWLAGVYVTQGRFAKALDMIRARLKMAEKSGERSWAGRAYFLMANILMAKGDLKGAATLNEEGRKIFASLDDRANLRQALWLKGMIQAEMRDFGGAMQTAAELRRAIEKCPFKREARFDHLLTAKIELARGNYDAAVAAAERDLALEKGDERTKPPLGYLLMGDALFGKGDFEKARRAYETILAQTSGRLEEGFPYPLSYLRLGQVEEKIGDKPAAIARYSKFLDLWKDADPGLPQGEEARARLAALK